MDMFFSPNPGCHSSYSNFLVSLFEWLISDFQIHTFFTLITQLHQPAFKSQTSLLTHTEYSSTANICVVLHHGYLNRHFEFTNQCELYIQYNSYLILFTVHCYVYIYSDKK